jgi:hypothetical protein
LSSELAALGDGRDVGAVDGEDAFEDVAGFGNIGAVGDHADPVLRASAGRRHVEPAACRCLADKVDAHRDGVRLVAVLGRRIPQPHMVPRTVGGQRHLAVSAGA